MEKWNKLKEFIDNIEPDVEKFYRKEFDETGGRVTVGMQELKRLAHDVRAEVLAIRNRNRAIKKAKKRL
jgi:hypothetical protein